MTRRRRRWAPRATLGLPDFLNWRDVTPPIDEELRFHIEARAEQLRKQGWSADEARIEAARRFGDLDGHVRACQATERRRRRRGRMAVHMESFWQDARFALRAYRRQPGFTGIVVLTLALGIGATTALFSVTDGVLLRSLPYPEADRLVQVAHFHSEPEAQLAPGAFSWPDFEDVERGVTRFRHIAAYTPLTRNLVGDGSPRRLSMTLGTADFFAALGRQPLLGRTFDRNDAEAGVDDLVVLSHDLWVDRFGADPDVLGRRVELSGSSVMIIGVMPEDFRFPSSDIEAWMPMTRMTEDMTPRFRGLRWQVAFGRLDDDETVETAGAQVDVILEALAEQHPDSNEGWTHAEIVPLKDTIVGDVKNAVLLLFVATGLVLLIACANVANLLLARLVTRDRELAVRVALGASRGRLVRQGLIESVMLALAGGAVGMLVAWLGVNILTSVSAGTLPRVEDIGLDWRTAGFAFLASLVTGVLFGLAPALSSDAPPGDALRDGRSATGGGRNRLRGALVVGEVALSAMLVIAAGLMLRSFWTIMNVDPGFDTDNTIAVALSIPPDRLESTDQTNQYRQELLDALGAIPGVESVGSSKNPPLAGGGEPFGFELRDERGSVEVTPGSGVQFVTTGFFETLGIPIVSGRAFARGDPGLFVVVNQTLATKHWPNEDAIGKRLYLGDNEIEIIGVVADIRHEGIEGGTDGVVYAQSEVFRRSSVILYARTETASGAFTQLAREAIWSVNPDQPIASVEALSEQLTRDVARPRFFTLLVVLFAGVALTLSVLGIYGVISYSVGRRTAEIGVRMALGATHAGVVRMVLADAMPLLAAGLAAGLVGAFWLSRLFAGLLYGVSPRDPATYVAVTAVLFTTAVLASLVPAARASRLSPVDALRSE
jgi:predicted permease